MDSLEVISGVISDIEDFLSKPFSDVQGRIFLKHRINEVGKKMNTLFYNTGKSIPIDVLNKELFSMAMRLKRIVNKIPNTIPSAQDLATSLLFYVLNNYFYSSTTEESRINSMAIGLSSLLSGLPEPFNFWPPEDIENLEAAELDLANKSYNVAMTMYFTLFTKALYEQEDNLFGWARKFLEYDSVLYRIDRKIQELLRDEVSTEKLTLQYDLVTTHCIYVIEMANAILSTVRSEEELRDYVMERSQLMEKCRGWIQLVRNCRDDIRAKVQEGKINKNDLPENTPSFMITEFGHLHAETMQSLNENLGFETMVRDELHNVFEQLQQNYTKLISIHGMMNAPVNNSPFAPVVMGLITNILLLSYLLKAPVDIDIMEHFQEVTKESFELHLVHALTHTDEVPFQRTGELKKIPAIMTCNMTTALVLHELLLTANGQQPFEVMINNLEKLRDEIMDYQEKELAISLQVYIDYLITARQEEVSLSWDKNYYDMASAIDARVEIEGREYTMYPFSTNLSLRRGIFREMVLTRTGGHSTDTTPPASPLNQ